MSDKMTLRGETYVINSMTYNLHIAYKGQPLDDEYYRRLAEITGFIEGYKARRDSIGLFGRIIKRMQMETESEDYELN